MIDYEKLKVAHNLLYKYGEMTKNVCYLNMKVYGFNSHPAYYELYVATSENDTFVYLDDLISRLERLTLTV